MADTENMNHDRLEANIIGKVVKAREFKNKGNYYFKEKNYKKALYQYHSGLMYLKGVECDIRPAALPISNKRPSLNLPEEVEDDIDILNAELQNNLAACLLKRDPVRYDRVLECCFKVIEKQPDNLKALYRTGLAYYHLKDYSKAKEAVKKANEITRGKDSAVRNLIVHVNSKLKEEDKECMELYKNSLLKNSFK